MSVVPSPMPLCNCSEVGTVAAAQIHTAAARPTRVSSGTRSATVARTDPPPSTSTVHRRLEKISMIDARSIEKHSQPRPSAWLHIANADCAHYGMR